MHRHDDADHVGHRQQLDNEIPKAFHFEVHCLLRRLSRREVLELVTKQHDLVDAGGLDEQQHGGEEVGPRSTALLWRDLVEIVLNSSSVASAHSGEELFIRWAEGAALQCA